MKGTDYPYVSVIIPVFNDAEKLEFCLTALIGQSFNRSQYEIIIIDNGSDEIEPVKTLVDHYGIETFAVELNPGSYAARNRGISLAKGDIIAFTDADCIPAQDWIEQGVKSLTTPPENDMVVGSVETFAKDNHLPNLLERYEMIMAFPQKTYFQQGRGGATANIFVRRHVFDCVGTFNSHLKSFGDLEWGRRVYLANYKQIYSSQVRVRHPARSSWVDLSRKTIRVAGGLYDFFVKPGDPWLKRQKTYARLVVDDLCSMPNSFLSIWTSPHVQTLSQRLGILGIVFWLKFLAIWEKTRLHYGGISRRA